MFGNEGGKCETVPDLSEFSLNPAVIVLGDRRRRAGGLYYDLPQTSWLDGDDAVDGTAIQAERLSRSQAAHQLYQMCGNTGFGTLFEAEQY